MKFSPKQMLIRKHVKKSMAWRFRVCECCGNYIIFETMYKVKGSFYCWSCCRTKEEAFDLAFPKKVSAYDLAIRQEKRNARKTISDLLEDIHALPDGEVSPSVMSVLLKAEGLDDET